MNIPKILDKLLGILGIVVIIFFVYIILLAANYPYNLECSLRQYEYLHEWQQEFPELRDIVKKKYEDNKISYREFEQVDRIYEELKYKKIKERLMNECK